MMKNFIRNMDDDEGPITPKEKFALIFLIISGLVIGLMFLMFIWIFTTTYEFSEFSLDFQPVG
ncbi:MAG: hypothetical protein ACTSO9_21070 [Candidatus Helarchaeota archaeon]